MNIHEELINPLLQLYIDMWAEYEKDGLSQPYIDFLKTTASATRSYLKSTGQWED